MSTITTLDHRLRALPPKIGTPLRSLLSAEHLSEDATQAILDAGELSNDYPRLLGFAIAYHHLRAQNVPVHDVIRMAKSQGRTVNLTWGAKRWKAEHERLSRAETLTKLAGENISYNVTKFAALMPARFDGYLIRSSRRLGMEGLRQRHCVASYHSQLQSGSCAIAAVFVDRQRWTVQLHPTDNADHPLRITQIKTRYNGVPSAAIRKRIHEMLGIAIETTPAAPSAETNERSYLTTLQRVLPILREHHVDSVCVSFDGCGDSGSIYHVAFAGPDHFDGKDHQITYTISHRYFDDGQWRFRSETRRGSLYEAIEELTYDYLEQTGVDWYNNDGGYGELEIDVENGTVRLDVDVRYTESTNEYGAEIDIMTGEEL